MKKKKIMKVFGIILVIILVIFIIHTTRNFIIIKNLQSKISGYANNDNHNIKIITTNSNGTLIKVDYYKKDNKKVVFLEREKNGEKVKLSIYDTGESHHTYTDTEDTKRVSLNGGFIEVQLYNGVETENIWQTLLSSVVANIRNVNENGKEYYQLKHTISPYAMSFDGEAVLVDKETGLMYKNTNTESTSVREYEFNNVDDGIFIEPDISEYEIQEN